MMRFSITAWTGWSSGPDTDGVKRVPALMRRRVTPLGRNGLGAASLLPALDTARYVFSSRHGEFNRTLTILRTIAAAEDVSPTEFSMSVHHALAGMLSIAHGNHGGHTALAAGSESFCLAMVEAAACLVEKPDQPVLLLHYDEPLADEYARFDTGEPAAVLALLLQSGGANALTFTMSDNQPDRPSGPDAAPAAQAFWRFLQDGAPELTWDGQTHHWHWVRHAVA